MVEEIRREDMRTWKKDPKVYPGQDTQPSVLDSPQCNHGVVKVGCYFDLFGGEKKKLPRSRRQTTEHRRAAARNDIRLMALGKASIRPEHYFEFVARPLFPF